MCKFKYLIIIIIIVHLAELPEWRCWDNKEIMTMIIIVIKEFNNIQYLGKFTCTNMWAQIAWWWKRTIMSVISYLIRYKYRKRSQFSLEKVWNLCQLSKLNLQCNQFYYVWFGKCLFFYVTRLVWLYIRLRMKNFIIIYSSDTGSIIFKFLSLAIASVLIIPLKIM